MGRRNYTPEFRRSAVALVIEQKYTRQEAAKNLGISITSLDNWMHEHRKLNGSADAAEELDLKKRVAELERENRRLTMERDILKKAAGYLAQEHL